MKQPLSVAVVGVGRWGTNLVRAARAIPAARITALCDVDRRRLDLARGPLPSGRTATELEHLLGLSDVDAVVIATPSALHATHAAQALASGRHVFVEKPMATSYHDAKRLVDLARAQRRRLMVGHILEHHPSVAILHDRARRGSLGRIRRIETCRLGAAASTADSWWTLAPHDLSVIRLLLGAPERLQLRTVAPAVDGGAPAGSADRCAESRIGHAAESPIGAGVQGRVDHPAQGSADRSVHGRAACHAALLEFPGGATASVRVGARGRPKTRRITVVGTRSTAVFDDTQQLKLRIYDHSGGRGEVLPPLGEGEEPLLLEMGRFVRSIVDGVEPGSDGVAGAQIVRLLEAGTRSLELGAAWVSPSEIDESLADPRAPLSFPRAGAV
jgi:predicted dehydrogenase